MNGYYNVTDHIIFTFQIYVCSTLYMFDILMYNSFCIQICYFCEKNETEYKIHLVVNVLFLCLYMRCRTVIICHFDLSILFFFVFWKSITYCDAFKCKWFFFSFFFHFWEYSIVILNILCAYISFLFVYRNESYLWHFLHILTTKSPNCAQCLENCIYYQRFLILIC